MSLMAQLSPFIGKVQSWRQFVTYRDINITTSQKVVIWSVGVMGVSVVVVGFLAKYLARRRTPNLPNPRLRKIFNKRLRASGLRSPNGDVVSVAGSSGRASRSPRRPASSVALSERLSLASGSLAGLGGAGASGAPGETPALTPQQLGAMDKDCKKAWALLRDAFRRAMKRSKESESGQASVPQRKWKYKDEMSFLLPHLKERMTLSSVRNEHDDEDSFPAENLPKEEAHQASPEFIQPESDTSPENIPSSPAQTHTPLPKRQKISSQSMSSETPSTILMKFLLDNNTKSKNDIQQFFDSVSTTVQSFPRKDRAIAKAKVFRVISEMELEILNRNTPFDTESMSSCEMQLQESPFGFGDEDPLRSNNYSCNRTTRIQPHNKPKKRNH